MFKKVEAPYMTSSGLKVGSSVIAISKMDRLYVKNHTTLDKVKRALLIALVFAFVGILAHPLYVGLPLFLFIFVGAYLSAPEVELRTLLVPTDDMAAVDTGLHKSTDPHIYQCVVEKFHALKAYEDIVAHRDDIDE